MRPRKRRPEMPSLAMTIRRASPYPIGVVEVCVVVLMTRTELEQVSETADEQKPTWDTRMVGHKATQSVRAFQGARFSTISVRALAVHSPSRALRARYMGNSVLRSYCGTCAFKKL
eukprot:scaffold163058_cov30-Tisochrysis_lutea.AAC.3